MARHVPDAVIKNAARLMKRHVLNPDLPWEKQRARMASALLSARAPSTVRMTTEAISDVSCEVLVPASGEPTGTLIHIHGGGFTVGSPASSRGWTAALSTQLGLRIVAPDYSLAPEFQFPQSVNEVGRVVAAELDARGAANVVVSGDSAGGNLALVTTLDRIKASSTVPAGLILLSPWLDLTIDRLDDPNLVRRDPLLNPAWLAACAVAYAPGKLDDPRVSPLLDKLEGLPPVLVQGGSDDILAPDATRLVAAVEDSTDVSFSVGAGLWHDFVLQVGMLTGADVAFGATMDFLGEVLEL